MKESALRTLAESLVAGIDTKGALQHIASGTLLCTVHLRCNRLRVLVDSGYVFTRLRVHGVIIMGTVSRRFVHWRRYAAVEDAYVKDVGKRLVRSRSKACIRLKVAIPKWINPTLVPIYKNYRTPDGVPLSHKILGLLLESTDYNLRLPACERNYSDYKAYTISQQRKFFSIPIPDIPNKPISIKLGTPSADIADIELFRLATLIYLGRASDLLGQEDGSKLIEK
ncbi:hypothetical protein N431DRAFT_459064 [Stipitochalara longipes BDJ]|nr:hypothetical protein N431DRAFT_459064 [Stipitochalara longipes BDJ]